MKYTKSSQGTGSDEDQAINATLAGAGVAVLSAAWGLGMLTIETDQPLPPELAQLLGLSAEQE